MLSEWETMMHHLFELSPQKEPATKEIVSYNRVDEAN